MEQYTNPRQRSEWRIAENQEQALARFAESVLAQLSQAQHVYSLPPGSMSPGEPKIQRSTVRNFLHEARCHEIDIDAAVARHLVTEQAFQAQNSLCV